MAFDLEAWLQRLPRDVREKAPVMPVHVALYEAKVLFDITSKRRDDFAVLPDFDLEAFDGMPVLIEALDQKERAWVLMRKSAPLTQAREAAETFRGYFTDSARFLLRREEKALADIDDICEGSGNEDLAADMTSIALVAGKPEWAAKLALDKELPRDISAHARGLGKQMIEARDTTEAIEAQQQRNQFFWLLDEAVGELRAGSQFLYRDDPKTLAMIASGYEAKKKRRARARKKEKVPGTEPK